MSVPKRTGLLTLLRESAGSQFVIPVYQRNYTWEANKEVKQYLHDLKDVLDGKYKSHFLGIIIYHEKQLDFSSRELSVIDGQQRLTTTFLILYAAKKMFANKGNDAKVNDLNVLYLWSNPSGHSIKYKLKPLVSDDDVYKCIVEDRFDEITDNTSNVIKNYNYIFDFLNDLLINGYELNDILLAMDKLNLVVIPLDEDDNAQKIFESINATGVKLTAADLIRNYLLMDLPSEVQDDYYDKYWRKLESHISQDSKQLEMFFRMYLAIKRYELVSKSNVYREFVQWVEEQTVDTRTIFEDLLKYSKIYYILNNENILNINKNIRSTITDFRKMNYDLSLPLFLEFYAMHCEDKIESSTLNLMYSTINSYLIRRSICDLSSQNISRLFPSVLKRVLESCNGDYQDILTILQTELVAKNINTSGSYMPTNKQMFELLQNANVYGRPALRVIFERLELNDNPAPVDLKTLSIEHLMPQTPSDKWLEELDTELPIYNEYLHKLGNLTLATKPDNTKMKNLLWEYKNKILESTGHLKMNMELLTVARWNFDRIEQRTKTLIEKICELYPYPEIQISNDMGDPLLTPKEVALGLSISKAIENDSLEIKKNTIFKNELNSNGYIVSYSKLHTSGRRNYFWFGYRDYRFDLISEVENKYLILSCGKEEVITIKLSKQFLDGVKDRFVTSTNEDGTISHYHLTIFDNETGCSLLLSKPTLEEIDITEFILR